jgi:hypothetical protein
MSVDLNIEGIRSLIALMREAGVLRVRCGGIEVVLGSPVQKPANEAAPNVDRAPSIGPDGKPMSEHDRMLFSHILGDD